MELEQKEKIVINRILKSKVFREFIEELPEEINPKYLSFKYRYLPLKDPVNLIEHTDNCKITHFIDKTIKIESL